MTAAPEKLRIRGQRTRAALIAAAERLLEGRPVGEVSVSQIAAAAGAFPNQVTYYFGSKEALFVEVAFRSLLRETVQLENPGRRAATPQQFTHALSTAAARLTWVAPVAEALLIVRRHPELTKIVDYGLSVLFRESERYLGRTLTERGWTCTRPLELEVRAFWCGVLGSALLQAAADHGHHAGPVSDLLTVRAAGG